METALHRFKNDCLNEPVDRAVQKYIIDGNSHFFSIEGKHDEYSFKRKLADSLKVHIRDIAIVGSGKLGFSVKPDGATGEYLWHEFDKRKDGKKSDLDVAIVSSRLFDAQIKRLYQLAKNDATAFTSKSFSRLSNLALKGRLRPHLLPKKFVVTPEIDSAKRDLENDLGRDVNFEIYKSWFYLESYHEDNFKNMKINLES